MKKEKYEAWLKEQDIDYKTQTTNKSRIQSLEEHQNINIDDEYDKDKCSSLLLLFQYSKDDVYNERKPKHSIAMNSTTGKSIYDTYFEGTADYRSRIKKYIKFREETDSAPIIISQTNHDKTIRTERFLRKSDKVSKTPLNQIFYGPPGTGKTYTTINAALEILAPDTNYTIREEAKAAFDNFVEQGKICFVTFHQSFSYEDFVEGIRPTLSNSITVGNISYSIEDGIFKKICEQARKSATKEPYVLIIDEINRGNISGIFGELITLIEPSKRIGANEELKTILPYSRETFGVPDNLYIIGTMNTADRSLTGLDIALRRRFNFVEMPPKPELLKDKYIQDTNISLEVILASMNERIELLLGRDYCIGHAAFMNLGESVSINELKNIFQGIVIPLLQEYFFEDWNKIHLVLNDHKKDDDFRFVRKKELSSFSDDSEFSNLQRDIWEIDNEAFESLESYVGIVHPT